MDAKLRSTVVLAADISDDGLQWIEVMPTADKARNGPFYFTITETDLEALAASLAESPGQVPVDYDHEGADGGSTRAAGWFTGETQVVKVGDENPRGEKQDRVSLWAQVKWTAAAAAEIRDGVWKKFSPEWRMGQKDTKTGLWTRAKALLAGTLTNRPFFTDLAPVTAAEVLWDATVGYEQRRCAIATTLNPGDTWAYFVQDIADGAALVTKGDETWVVPYTVTAAGDVEVSPASEWKPAEQQWVAAAAEARAKVNAGSPGPTKENDMPADLKAVAVELGLAEDADEATVTAAVKALKEKTPDDGAIVVKADELAALKASAAKGEAAAKELEETKIDSLLADAVRDRQILPVQKDVLRAQALEHGIAGVKAFIDATPKGQFKEHGTGGSGGSGDGNVDKITATIDGVEFEADQESATLDVRARKILADAGKASYTADEYVAALEQAEKQTAAA